MLVAVTTTAARAVVVVKTLASSGNIGSHMRRAAALAKAASDSSRTDRSMCTASAKLAPVKKS
jgi:hypothetical protein